MNKIKRLLLPLLAALALPNAVEACMFGNCGSKLEAENACIFWKNKGGSYSYYAYGRNITDSYDDGGSGYIGGQRMFGLSVIIKSQEIRKCILEKETGKFLGMQIKGKKGKLYKQEDIPKSYMVDIRPEIKWEVKKRFKY